MNDVYLPKWTLPLDKSMTSGPLKCKQPSGDKRQQGPRFSNADPTNRLTSLTALLMCLAASLFTSKSLGQFPSSGISGQGSYQSSDVDSVDYSSGNVNVHIPLVSFPQLSDKLKLNFVIRYNQPLWSVRPDTISSQTQSLAGTWLMGQMSDYSPSSGFTSPIGVDVVRDQGVTEFDTDQRYQCTSGGQTVSCGGVGTLTPSSVGTTLHYVRDRSGASHVYGFSSNDRGAFNTVAPDGSGWKPIDSTQASRSFLDQNGVLYTRTGYSSGGIGMWNVSDPDGNLIQTTANGWQDSVGRQIPGTWGVTSVASSGEDDPYPGIPTSDLSHCASGSTSARIWNVPGKTAPYYLCFTRLSGTTAFNMTQWGTYSASVSESSHTIDMLTQVVLPNSRAYTFVYDPTYFDLTEIDLPQGGSIQYQWVNVHWTQPAPLYIKRVLASRTTSDGNHSYTTTYRWLPLPTGQVFLSTAHPSVLVSKPDGNSEWHFYDSRSSTETVKWFTGLASLAPDAVYNTLPSGNVAKTETTIYGSFGSPFYGSDSYQSSLGFRGPILNIKTTLEDGSVKETDYQNVPSEGPVTFYNPINPVAWQQAQQLTCDCINYSQIANIKEYDWGSGAPGALIRETRNSYQFQSSQPYKSANILNAITQTSVYDGSGNLFGSTNYTYDETRSVVGVTLSSGSISGHATTVSNSVDASSTVSQNTAYNSQGVATASIDGRLNLTSVTSFDCSGLFAGTINHAGVYQDGAVHDCATGAITQTTDANGNATVYAHNDSLGRVTGVNYPDGGSLSMQYTDGSHSFVTSTRSTGGSTPSLIQSVFYDGFGRTISETQGDVTTDTLYDSMGRIAASSTPHSSGSGNTTWTSFAYDALERRLYVCNPDNGTSAAACAPGASYREWLYSGPSTTIIDEQNIASRQTEDALGRLISVTENAYVSRNGQSCGISCSGGPTTTYSYNVLGNLTGVSQPGAHSSGGIDGGSYTESPRIRSFTYDGLSRLITASNPEAGTICYGLWSGENCVNGYDPNGNLLYKTDARNITTAYSYDALNRLIHKTYSNGQYDQWYSYDGKDESGNPLPSPASTNAIGHLSHTSNGVNVASHYAYDVMGRLSYKADCMPSDCSYNVVTQAGYDQAGNMTSLTYPDGRKVSTGFDAAGRMNSVSYAAWGATQKSSSYLNVPNGGYDPGGHLVGADFGNGVGMVAGYDARQRIGTLAYGTTSQLFWGRNYTWTPNSNMDSWTDLISGNQRQFSYDSFNRLTSAVDHLGSSASNQTSSSVVSSTNSSTQVTIRFTNDSCSACSGQAPNQDRNLYVSSASVGVNQVAGSDSVWSYAGGGNSGGNLMSSGDMTATFSGSGTMSVTAYGSPDNGAYPHMQLLVNGALVGEWDVTNIPTAYSIVPPANNSANVVMTPPMWTDPDDSNLLPYADDASVDGTPNTGWVAYHGTISSSPANAPDGSATALTYTSAPGSTDSYMSQSIPNGSSYQGETMTGSIWLRTVNNDTETLNLGIGSGFGVIGAPITVTPVWQQFSQSVEWYVPVTNMSLQLSGATGSPFVAVQFWGAKLEDAGVAGRTVTNYLQYSQRMTAPTWEAFYSQVSDNAAIAPDGTQTAAKVDFSNVGGQLIDHIPYPVMVSDNPITASIWLRSPSATPQRVTLWVYTTGASSGGNLGMQDFQVDGQWRRYQITGTSFAGTNMMEFLVGGDPNVSVQAWGAQLEMGQSAGPYIPTAGQPVSRGTELTNLLPYSSQMNGPTWGSSLVASQQNSVVAPDSSQTAMQATSSGDAWITDDVKNPGLYDGMKVTGSVFLRRPSGSSASSTTVFVFAETAAGRIYQASQNVSLTEAWQRVAVTPSSPLPTGVLRLLLQVGGGGSFSSGQVIDVWGAQLEVSDHAGIYVPTSTLPILAGQKPINLMYGSQVVNGPGWIAQGTVVSNSNIAPDGTQTAATFTASGGSILVDQVMNPSLYDLQQVTTSVYLRTRSGLSQVHLAVVAATADGYYRVAEQWVPLSSTWRRPNLTTTSPLPAGLQRLYLQIEGMNPGDSFDVWGPQLVVGTAPQLVDGNAPGGYTPTSATVNYTTGNGSSGTGASMANGMNLQYGYDSFGNITTYGSFSPTYNVKNQMNNFAYDASGNLLQTGTAALAWDAESRLSSAGGAAYLYDAEGNRVESSGIVVTDTVYFNGRPVARLSNGQWTDLIYGPQGLIAEVAGSENAEPGYRLTDHLGTLVGNLGKANDGSPIFINPMDYTPFGQAFSGNTSDPYFFTGKERDTESGLDNFGFRYYGSLMGRFMSPDPSGLFFADPTNPQSLNLYSYAQNNPLKNIDPDGLRCVWDDGSFDSEDDKQTGKQSDCEAAGGTYHKPGEYSPGIDWAGSNADGTLTLHTNSVFAPGYAHNQGGPPTSTGAGIDLLFSGIPGWGFDALNYIIKGGNLPNDSYRLFTTTYCGKGGAGSQDGVINGACARHDKCFDDAHLSADNNAPGAAPMSDTQKSAATACNQALYNAARANPTRPGAKALEWWLVQGSHPPFGGALIAPGTEAKPW